MQYRSTRNFSPKRIRQTLLLALGLLCALFILIQMYADPSVAEGNGPAVPEMIQQASKGITAQVADWMKKALPQSVRL